MNNGGKESAAICVAYAETGDLPAILGILNHYILTHHCTFDTRPWGVSDKRGWFDSCNDGGPCRLLVARRNGTLLGYAHSGRWRPKAAYDITVETTVYVSPDHHAGGVGRALMTRLLDDLSGTGLHSAVAGIAQPNAASNRLHESLGYAEVGTFREAGYKFGQFWDVTWYQKPLSK